MLDITGWIVAGFAIAAAVMIGVALIVPLLVFFTLRAQAQRSKTTGEVPGWMPSSESGLPILTNIPLGDPHGNAGVLEQIMPDAAMTPQGHSETHHHSHEPHDALPPVETLHYQPQPSVEVHNSIPTGHQAPLPPMPDIPIPPIPDLGMYHSGHGG